MKHIIYARKSTEQEERQAMSIDSQVDELLRLAERSGLKIDKTYRESMSAKKMGRPIFNEMLEYISQEKGCIVLAWKVDRLTRNIFDGAKIIELLENGNIKEIRTIDKVIMDNPIDKFMLSIDFGVGKKYSDDLSVNVKRGNRAKLKKGEWPNMAPIGYKNENKKIIVDEKRSKFIQKAFDLYATGGYSVTEIADILFRDGFCSRKGYKYSRSRIHTMLTNSFYYGAMRLNGEIFVGNHNPLVSKELFDKVQSAIFGKHHSKKEKHFYAMRGFLKCENCGCVLTPARKKGHLYYYCTNGKGNCEEHKKYLRSKDLEKAISKKFEDLKFNSKLIEIAYKSAKEKTNLTKTYLETSKVNLTNRLTASKTKLERLLNGYCEGNVAGDVYEAKSRELKKEEIDLKTQLNAIEQKIAKEFSTLEQTKKTFLKAFNAEKEFAEAKDERKRNLMEILLWNATFQNQEMAKISYKMPYQLLADEPEKGDFGKLLPVWDKNFSVEWNN